MNSSTRSWSGRDFVFLKHKALSTPLEWLRYAGKVRLVFLKHKVLRALRGLLPALTRTTLEE